MLNSLYVGSEIKKIFFEQKILNLPDNAHVSQISTDTRSINPDALFIALKGEKMDGHDFTSIAIKKGASVVVVERIDPETEQLAFDKGTGIVFVNSTLDALFDIARYNRARMDGKNVKVIAITGTIGKTTVTQWIHKLLSKFFNMGLCVQGYNNHIGMCINLSNSYKNSDVVVLEMGMNHVGEIDFLSSIARPHIAIVTNITPVHLGTGDFAKIEQIAEAKSEIFNHLHEDGIVILNKANSYYSILLEKAKKNGIKKIITVGNSDSNIYIQNTVSELYKTSFDVVVKFGDKVDVNSYVINALARHQAFNITFMVAIAKLFKLDKGVLENEIKTSTMVKGRGDVEYVRTQDGKKVIVINDTYNASPESVKMSIETLSVVYIKPEECDRRVLIFGDMLELGEFSSQYHLEVAEHVNTLGNIKAVFTVGEFSKITHDNLKNEIEKKHYATRNELLNDLKNILQNKDVVLVKGSNSIGLDKVIEKLYK